MKQEITRKRRRTTMAESPRPASHGFTSAMWRKTPVQISTKDEPSNFRPNSPFICVDATVRAAADTNLFFFIRTHKARKNVSELILKTLAIRHEWN